MSLRWGQSFQAPTRSSLAIAWPASAGLAVQEIEERLFSLFPDHDPKFLGQNDGQLLFALVWPSHLLSHTDPLLAERAIRHYGIGMADIAGYYELGRCGGAEFIFSMFHSRALLAPAYAAGRAKGQMPRTIVHVDAHSDLAAPLMIRRAPGELVNPSFSGECWFDSPEAVIHTVNQGLIHKGSFLAAYMLANPAGTLFHVWENSTPASRFLTPGTSTIRVGESEIPYSLLVPTDQPTADGWLRSNLKTLPQDLPNADESGIWLDVDLDAFCNRFDGDSDRRDLGGSSQERDTLVGRIQEFLGCLKETSWRERVTAVSVAASPGFFPSEYWEEVIPNVREGIFSALTTVCL